MAASLEHVFVASIKFMSEIETIHHHNRTAHAVSLTLSMLGMLGRIEFSPSHAIPICGLTVLSRHRTSDMISERDEQKTLSCAMEIGASKCQVNLVGGHLTDDKVSHTFWHLQRYDGAYWQSCRNVKSHWKTGNLVRERGGGKPVCRVNVNALLTCWRCHFPALISCVRRRYAVSMHMGETTRQYDDAPHTLRTAQVSRVIVVLMVDDKAFLRGLFIPSATWRYTI